MTLAEYVDGLAKRGTIDGNIAERIMGLHREATFLPCVAIRNALMPIVAEMDEYHGRCTVEVQCAHDKFWDEHEPQTIGDFSDSLTDAIANLCGEIASDDVRKRLKNCRKPLNVAVARAALDKAECVLLCAARFAEDKTFDDKTARELLADVDWDGGLNAVRTALESPARECDVGSADEQSERFDAHCRRNVGCGGCPAKDADGSVPKHCEFRWGQGAHREGGVA